jgi:hypothetical protein
MPGPLDPPEVPAALRDDADDHHHHHHGHDLNLRSAYLHVLADALTSVLAIAALLAGKFLARGGWTPCSASSARRS